MSAAGNRASGNRGGGGRHLSPEAVAFAREVGAHLSMSALIREMRARFGHHWNERSARVWYSRQGLDSPPNDLALERYVLVSELARELKLAPATVARRCRHDGVRVVLHDGVHLVAPKAAAAFRRAYAGRVDPSSVLGWYTFQQAAHEYGQSATAALRRQAAGAPEWRLTQRTTVDGVTYYQPWEVVERARELRRARRPAAAGTLTPAR